MSQISLTASMRSNLLSLQGTANLMSQTQDRLASGKKVNSAIDNPSSFYTAQSLSNRANDLSGLLDSMGQAVSTIKAANEGIEAITTFVEQAKAVATSALSDTDIESRKDYGEQFNTIIKQLDEMAQDSGYKGINLLQGDKLTVTFNETRTNKLEIQGEDVNYTNLGMSEQDWDIMGKDAVQTALTAKIAAQGEYDTEKAKAIDVSSAKKVVEEGKVVAGTPAADTKAGKIITDGTNFWKIKTDIDAHGEDPVVISTTNADALVKGEDGLYYTATDKATADPKYAAKVAADGAYDRAVKNATEAVATSIQSAIDAASDAIVKLRGYASDFGNSYSIVETRQSFTENLINVLEEGADKLTLADMNEESANMLALQTRQQLAINSLSLASQAAQSVLKLF